MANISPKAENPSNNLQQFSTGTFSLKGKSFKNNDCTYLVCTRKQITPNKPHLFLLQVKPLRQYISSLYGTSTLGQYNFDFNGSNYTLKLNEQRTELTLSLSISIGLSATQLPISL